MIPRNKMRAEPVLSAMFFPPLDPEKLSGYVGCQYASEKHHKYPSAVPSKYYCGNSACRRAVYAVCSRKNVREYKSPKNGIRDVVQQRLNKGRKGPLSEEKNREYP